MSTKNSLILIVAVALLAVAGLGASRFISPDSMRGFVKDDTASRSEAFQVHDQMAAHADALDGSSNRSRRMDAFALRDQLAAHADALQGSAVRSGRAEALAIQDEMRTHADALAGDVVTFGEWYGAIPQTSSAFNAVEALRLRDLIVEHAESLAR